MSGIPPLLSPIGTWATTYFIMMKMISATMYHPKEWPYSPTTLRAHIGMSDPILEQLGYMITQKTHCISLSSSLWMPRLRKSLCHPATSQLPLKSMDPTDTVASCMEAPNYAPSLSSRNWSGLQSLEVWVAIKPHNEDAVICRSFWCTLDED